jgi:dTDP-glucose 4,6-dehydratase
VSVTVLDALTYAGSRESLRSVEDKIRLAEGDLVDAALLDTLVAESDAVVHFAAETHVDNTLGGPEPFVRGNVVGTLVGSRPPARRAPAPRLHRRGVRRPASARRRAIHCGGPFNPSSPNSATKAAANLLVRAWVRSYDVRATISNCSNNYGPYQHIEKFILHQITNILPGRDWIHVEHHNSAVWRILSGGARGSTYLIGAEGERRRATPSGQ